MVILGVIRLEMRIFDKVGVASVMDKTQDEGSETEMVLTCKEEMHKHTGEKVREVGYRRFGHVKRRCIGASVRKCERLVTKEERQR